MQELIAYMVNQFLEETDYDIIILEDDSEVIIKLTVDKDKIAKVIGKNGRIARSMRTIVKSSNANVDKKCSFLIEER